MSAALALVAALLAASEPEDRQRVIVVVGAPGTPDYGKDFARAADDWAAATGKGGAALVQVGRDPEGDATDRARLQAALAGAPRRGAAALWLVLIGHGTFDGREAKFNLRGPDVSAAELAGWIEGFERPVAVINCAAASGPFLNRLSAPPAPGASTPVVPGDPARAVPPDTARAVPPDTARAVPPDTARAIPPDTAPAVPGAAVPNQPPAARVVVTATRSGHENNYARFGIHLAASIADPAADLDKDGQTSLLEGYLAAAARVGEFYEQEGRLATEHSLLDDSGDGQGTPASWFQGLRAVRRARDGAALDGLRAHQLHLVPSTEDREMPAPARARRDRLELEIARLRDRKGELTEGDYYARLEPLLLELARLYEELKEPEKAGAGPGNSARR